MRSCAQSRRTLLRRGFRLVAKVISDGRSRSIFGPERHFYARFARFARLALTPASRSVLTLESMKSAASKPGLSRGFGFAVRVFLAVSRGASVGVHQLRFALTAQDVSSPPQRSGVRSRSGIQPSQGRSSLVKRSGLPARQDGPGAPCHRSISTKLLGISLWPLRLRGSSNGAAVCGSSPVRLSQVQSSQVTQAIDVKRYGWPAFLHALSTEANSGTP